MNPRNKYWRRQKLVQKYITRLKKFPASRFGLWCDNQHWTLPYKSTATPCSCWLCRGYNRREFKKETKLEIEMF